MQIFGLPQTASGRETNRQRGAGPTEQNSGESVSLGESTGGEGLMPRQSFAPPEKGFSPVGLLRSLARASMIALTLAGVPLDMAAAATPQATTHQEQVRPEVRSFLQELKDGSVTGVKHTTRGLQMQAPYAPKAPQPFGAGRFQVDFLTADGQSRAFVVDTESKVGHLGNVVPGQTDVGGSIALLSNPEDSHSVTVRLTPGEQRAMLESLYAKAGQPMGKNTAQQTDFALSAVAAVHFSGQGEQAVQDFHAQLTGR